MVLEPTGLTFDEFRTIGVLQGDKVYMNYEENGFDTPTRKIENNLGRIRQKARLSAKIHPRVVIAEHGWWFPERRDDMHGWLESNLNALSDSNPPYAREMGSVTLKATPCRVVKEFSKGGNV